MEAEEQPDERARGWRRARGDDSIERNDELPTGRARYSEEQREKARESARKWKAANPERARAQNREQMRRAAAARKAKAARSVRDRARYHEHREEQLARHRQLREDHPDKVREYRDRYRAKHPERVVEQSRRASERWRDVNADAVRAANRVAAEKRRQQDPDYQRRAYHRDVDAQRARSRTNSRRRSRLKELGLPPRRTHAVYADQKRANQRAADAFFSVRRTAAQKRDLQLEMRAPYTRLMRAESHRATVGGDASSLEERLNAARDIDAERALWEHVLPGLVTRFTEKHRDRIREEIRLDSVARHIAGKPAYDTAIELARRIRAEAFLDAVQHLAPDHDPARLRRLHQMMFPRNNARQAQPAAERIEASTSASAPVRQGLLR